MRTVKASCFCGEAALSVTLLNASLLVRFGQSRTKRVGNPAGHWIYLTGSNSASGIWIVYSSRIDRPSERIRSDLRAQERREVAGPLGRGREGRSGGGRAGGAK